ncbi:hypothetical protein [Halomonas sp. C05BenzN]|uniref:hypothetical protein n=1 Tax=Halomonas sp. C05BenzN TaxID=3411041 RepID=UPI003B967359
MAGGDAVSEARGFTRQHLTSLSQDLLHWKSRGVLPKECRFHQLAELVARYSSEEDCYQMAELLVTRCSLEATAGADVPQPPSAQAPPMDLEVTLFDVPSGPVRGTATLFLELKGKAHKLAHAILLTDAPADVTNVTIKMPRRLAEEDVARVAGALMIFSERVREVQA